MVKPPQFYTAAEVQTICGGSINWPPAETAPHALAWAARKVRRKLFEADPDRLRLAALLAGGLGGTDLEEGCRIYTALWTRKRGVGWTNERFRKWLEAEAQKELAVLA